MIVSCHADVGGAYPAFSMYPKGELSIGRMIDQKGKSG
jgi:hypothetical protein